MTIIYNAKDHFSVIFSLHGSTWPAVLPWCLLNVVVATIVWFARSRSSLDLTFDGGLGYNYISILVSFFIVSNINTTYNRFWEARGHLATAFHEVAMLAARAALYTAHDTSPRARQWRTALKLRLMELVQTAMFVVQNERASLVNVMGGAPDDAADPQNGTTFEKHGLRRSAVLPQVSELEKSDPVLLAMQVDGIILAHDRYLRVDAPHGPLGNVQLNDLLGRTSTFLNAWSALLKFSTTPRPFVTVQIGRTVSSYRQVAPELVTTTCGRGTAVYTCVAVAVVGLIQ